MSNSGIRFLYLFLFVLTFAFNGEHANAVGEEATTAKAISTLTATSKIVGVCPNAASSIAAANGSLATCLTSVKAAGSLCLESTSPQLQSIAGLMGLMSGATKALSSSEVCSKMKKDFDLVGTMLTAYAAACGGAKLTCETTCGSAITSLKAAKVQVDSWTKTYMAWATAAAAEQDYIDAEKSEKLSAGCAETSAEITKAIPGPTEGVAACGSYGLLLASAGVGALNMIKEAKAASDCKDDLNGGGGGSTTTTTTVPPPPDKVADRDILKNQRPDVLTKPSGTETKTTMPFGFSGLAADEKPNFEGSKNGGGAEGGGANASGGSGGGISSGGGSGSGKGTDGGGTAGAKGFGFGRGGDGGGGTMGNNGGGGYNSADSELSKYLPGKEKDPSKRTPSGAAAHGVTTSGGMSNFEKINRMSFERANTLLNK